jgi:hypothetical protein
MRSIAVRVLLAALTALYVMVSPARAADADSTSMPPRWRLQATVLQSSSRELSLGVYHRLGSRWEIGSQLGSRFSASKDEHDSENQLSDSIRTDISNQSDHSNAAAATFEFRRWGTVEPRLSWFIGGQMEVAYTNSHTDSRQVRPSDAIVYRAKGKQHGPSGSLAMVLGADLTLLRRLSLLFAVRPIQYSHQWLDIERTTTYGTGSSFTRSHESGTDRSGAFTTDLTPEIYVTLHLGR